MKNRQSKPGYLDSSFSDKSGDDSAIQSASESDPLLPPISSTPSAAGAIDAQGAIKSVGGGITPQGPLKRRHAASSQSSFPLQMTEMEVESPDNCSTSRQEQEVSSLSSSHPQHQHLPHDRSNSQHTIPSLNPGMPCSSCDDTSTAFSYDAASASSQPLLQQPATPSNPSLPILNQRSSNNKSPSQHNQHQHHRDSSFSSSLLHQQNARANYIYQQRLLERQHYYNSRATLLLLASSGGNAAAARQLQSIMEDEPILEVPEEIYAVRRAALTVYRPLTRVWLVFTVGFSTTLVLGMSCWMHVIPVVFPIWIIFLPAWLSHIGLLVCHIQSAKALSQFISNANENRQKPDTTDHLDRTEYLPLLQKSLKFALKAGFIALCGFALEILIYIKVSSAGEPEGDTSHSNLTLSVVLLPVWIIVIGGVLDGLICKTQHWIRVLCWLLLLTSMIMAVLRVDYHLRVLSWRVIILPLVGNLVISGTALVYILYGHQLGYFRLTESQLTAGVLYALSVLVCTVLLVVMGEIVPIQQQVEFETRLFIVMLAPLVMSLFGVGAWAVGKDEFRRLQLHGGQNLVYPKKLRFEPDGWTAVEGRGVANIPMFGEVRYVPCHK